MNAPLTWNERLDIELRNRGNADVARLLALVDALSEALTTMTTLSEAALKAAWSARLETGACPQPPADLAALAEAAASDHAPRNALVAYFRAMAADHRRVAALDAEVVKTVTGWTDNHRSDVSWRDVFRALARRFGGTP